MNSYQVLLLSEEHKHSAKRKVMAIRHSDSHDKSSLFPSKQQNLPWYVFHGEDRKPNYPNQNLTSVVMVDVELI